MHHCGCMQVYCVGNISYGGIWMAGTLIEELCDCLGSGFDAVCLCIS